MTNDKHLNVIIHAEIIDSELQLTTLNCKYRFVSVSECCNHSELVFPSKMEPTYLLGHAVILKYIEQQKKGRHECRRDFVFVDQTTSEVIYKFALEYDTKGYYSAWLDIQESSYWYNVDENSEYIDNLDPLVSINQIIHYIETTNPNIIILHTDIGTLEIIFDNDRFVSNISNLYHELVTTVTVRPSKMKGIKEYLFLDGYDCTLARILTENDNQAVFSSEVFLIVE